VGGRSLRGPFRTLLAPGAERIPLAPVPMLMFSAQWSIGDGNPAVFHATNMLLYAGVSGLAALLAALLFTPGAGLAAGLLFAAHPVHVEVTANVVGQAELLSAAAYLGVLLLVWRSVRGPPGNPSSLGFLLGVGLLTFLGMAAKEHVVTLPGAILLLWWLAAKYSGESLAGLAGRHWPGMAAAVFGIIAYLAARLLVLGDLTDSGGVAPGLDPDSVLRPLVVMLPVSLHWLRLLFWPVHLSADYGPTFMPVRADPGWLHMAAVVVWIGILGAAWHLRHKLPALVLGAAFFLVTISVASSIVIPLEVRLAERFLFLPSAGWAMAMGGWPSGSRADRSTAAWPWSPSSRWWRWVSPGGPSTGSLRGVTTTPSSPRWKRTLPGPSGSRGSRRSSPWPGETAPGASSS
jgi:protein O-mannosyl-transferase